MGDLQSPIPTHLYPRAVQLRLYQAFIFSIPILFSIILFLLFYLFYLKRQASSPSSSSSSSPPILPVTSTTLHSSSYLSSAFLLDVKIELKDKLPVFLFNEELRTNDSLCCVCLGEYEMKEELLQVPSCKHIFHLDCIRLWFHTNATCPLCRSSILPSSKSEEIVQNAVVSSHSHEPHLNSHQTTPNN